MGMGAGLEPSSSMAGKGPKGYTRSDDRIREDVCDCLTDDPHLDASSIEVQVRNGEVTLSGTVSSRGAKRHAEDVAERASGVKNVQNSLRVQASGETGMTGSTIT
jgi:osmotically-inducible protein OsmY